MAVLGLHCRMGFALVVASGNCSLLQCMGFSLLWPLWLWSKGFSSCGTWAVVAAPRLPGTGSIAVVGLLSCSTACGIFPARDRNRVSCNGRRILYHWASREALSLFFFPEKVFFSLHFSMIIFWIQNSRLVVFLGFSFSTLNILHHSLLARMVSEENFDVIFHSFSSIGNVFSPFGFQLFSLPLIFVVWIYYT